MGHPISFLVPGEEPWKTGETKHFQTFIVRCYFLIGRMGQPTATQIRIWCRERGKLSRLISISRPERCEQISSLGLFPLFPGRGLSSR